jgi:hypothetical protein
VPQLNGVAVNGDSDAQRAAVVAPFPIRFVLMAIGAEALQVVRMPLEITIATRPDDVIHLRCGRDEAAQFTVLAKRPGT